MAVAAKLILLYFSKAQQSYYNKPPREKLRVSPHGKPELAGLKRNLKIAFDEIELESVAKLSKFTMPCQEDADEAILTDGRGGRSWSDGRGCGEERQRADRQTLKSGKTSS